MTRDPERLLRLLPAIYRTRDVAMGGPLRALLDVIGEQVELVEQDIAQMYDNWFIETCEDWVVPYIGELIGYAPVTAAGEASGRSSREGARRNQFLTPRREVAQTIALRRRRGTLAVLEELANDGAAWPARANELFRAVVVAQHVNFLMQRPGSVLVRNVASLDLVSGAFDQTGYSVDVRRPGSTRTKGRPNIPAVAMWTWRLAAYATTETLARAREADGDGLYSFSILGNDAPLFVRPIAESEATHIAEESNVPAPLRRRALHDNVGAYYGAGLSLRLFKGAESDRGPTEENAVPASAIRVANLSGWYYEPEAGTVVVDPVLGRFAFPLDELPAGDVWATAHHGFSANMGGGEYYRTVSENTAARVYSIAHSDGLDPIRAQLREWEAERTTYPHAILEIGDNGFYTETLDIVLAPGESLQLRAANGVRPILNLVERRPARPDPLVIRGSGGKFTLDGLLVVGRGLRLEGELDCVTIRHCTLVPGWDLTADCGPCNPTEPSILARQFRGMLRIDTSIVGGIHVHDDEVRSDPMHIEILDSIVDATERDHPAIGTQRAGIAHAIVSVARSTIVGTVWTYAMALAENSIFAGNVRVARRQLGCMRFCFVPEDSRTPRRHHCQPDLVRASAAASDAEFEAGRVIPRFTSLRYGRPGYAQLTDTCAAEIRSGADDESEMGAFHDLFQPQREATLGARLDEYIPAGFKAAIIHST
ncbi:MAG: hypothetical protein ABI120_09365 [Gemmatimonadaceae bacterium]